MFSPSLRLLEGPATGALAVATPDISLQRAIDPDTGLLPQTAVRVNCRLAPTKEAKRYQVEEVRELLERAGVKP